MLIKVIIAVSCQQILAEFHSAKRRALFLLKVPIMINQAFKLGHLSAKVITDGIVKTLKAALSNFAMDRLQL